MSLLTLFGPYHTLYTFKTGRVQMLPIFTGIEDLTSLLSYLKNKPTGATTAEIKAALGTNLVDPRKVSAYTTWKLVEKSGDRFRLSERGWRWVRKQAEEKDILREVIDSIVPYRSALEWAYHQHMDEVSNVDVAAHWHEHHSDQAGTDNANTLKDAAVCFFSVCQGAQLGRLIIGRRGQPTRLQLNRSELEVFVESGPNTLPSTASGEDEPNPASTKAEPATSGSQIDLTNVAPSPATRTPLRIFITHGKNMTLVEQVQTMLGLGGFESEVAEDEETAAIPVPEKVFSAMRRCQAGIIIVSADEANKSLDGKYSINENVLIEIGAAFVLYDRKVVLVWDRRITVPSNLQGLYRCEFEGSEFSWSAGMKLMKAIKDFKN
jgi:hypothetical protein